MNEKGESLTERKKRSPDKRHKYTYGNLTDTF